MGAATSNHPEADEDPEPSGSFFDRFLQALAPPDEWVAAHERR